MNDRMTDDQTPMTDERREALIDILGDALDGYGDPASWADVILTRLAALPQPATEPARPWLPMDPDPNAVKVAPGTWLHHGLYLRGQPATEPALDETARAINKAIDYLTDGDTVSTSEGRVAAARATLIAARLAAQPSAEVERLRAIETAARVHLRHLGRSLDFDMDHDALRAALDR